MQSSILSPTTPEPPAESETTGLPDGLIARDSITSCDIMRSTPTENPVAYAFSHPEAKRILQLVLSKGRVSYPDVGTLLHMYGETVHRTVRRLAQFNLVRVRAAPGARFQRGRIPLVIEPSRRTEEVCRVLAELDQVLVAHQQELGARTVQRLAVLA